MVRGLTDLTADQMVAFSDCYGITEQALDAPRLKNAHPENPAILRIGEHLNRLTDVHELKVLHMRSRERSQTQSKRPVTIAGARQGMFEGQTVNQEGQTPIFL